MTKKIVVAGDVTIDWLQWEIKAEEEKKTSKDDEKFPLNWKLYSGYNMVARLGGACLLAKMVDKALNNGSEEKEYFIISHDPTKELSDDPQKPKKIEDISPTDIIHSISLLDKFKDENGKVYRVKEFNGFSGPEGQHKILHVDNDDPDADIVAIDDAGNGFRDEPSAWPEAIKNKSKKPVIIYKMSRPLVKGQLWEKLKKDYCKNLVVVISVNDIRDIGINISKRLSWERTAQDFVWQIQNNEILNELKKCKHLIVRFGIDGAIYYRNNNNVKTADLFYDPRCIEDGYRDKMEGDMQGYGNAFLSAIVKHIAEKDLECIEDGIINAILSARKLLEYGFIFKKKEGKEVKEPFYPISEIFNVGNNEKDKKDEKKCKCTDNTSIAKVNIPIKKQKDLNWTILKSQNRLNIEDIARDFVINGFESLKGSNFGIPLGQFKGLRTVDKNEIEGYQSIRNLMKEYIERDNPKSPLCIAVFGPPGSGKSFGVNQLAKSIPGAKMKKLGFNVSQFNSQKDLIDALHKVRDEVLRGNIPLVFFDEFDAKLDEEELGWLKYFLAPMQDCKFKHGETMHPIGKSIFIFAGGTSSSFKEFSRETLKEQLKNKELEKDKRKEIERKIEKFRNSKGTDFVSRLRGYVDIMGPNPMGDDDSLYIIRRSIFLRSLLERKASNIIESKVVNIDDGVLRAFLMVPEYKHGVRSMEAIIDMSVLADKKKYGQSALPPARQIEMHVDSEKFLKIVEREVIFGNVLMKIAKKIHEQYLLLQERILYKEIIYEYLMNKDLLVEPDLQDEWLMMDRDEFLKNVSILLAGSKLNITREELESYMKIEEERRYQEQDGLQPWEDLSPENKQSNISQAKDIPAKLKAINYDFEPYIPSESVDELKIETFDEEDVEKLAKLEHERWKEQKENKNWVYGKVRDEKNKISPYITSWECLGPNIRELDRKPSRCIPQFLFDVGFRVYKVE